MKQLVGRLGWYKVFESAINAWKIIDLRKKILYTLFIIVLFRLGSFIPVPFLNADAIFTLFNPSDASGQVNNGALDFLNIMSGGAMERASIFAMSISPYINASIIMQLLTVAIPALERMQKEGDEGRKKIQQIVRYVTVLLGLIQGFGFYTILASQNLIMKRHWFSALVITISFTAGTALIMWLGEQINERGIGNGISIILFFSIISRGPDIVNFIVLQFRGGNYFITPILIIASVALIVFIVIMSNAERRLPVQYAKRVVGRKMYGGQSTHLPLKLSMTGVLPIIFASSFVLIPSTIARFIPSISEIVDKWFGYKSAIYALVYFFLIIAFNYFYVAMQYNPIEMANNIKKNGGFIPGIRPGKPTSDFISKVLGKITLIGALYLGLVAVLPIITSIFTNTNLAIGGTSILIVVGVILETLKTLESQMLMRHYKGFLE